MLRDAARVKLTDLVSQHGRAIGDDPEALQTILEAQWPDFVLERAVVVTAAKERVPSSLRSLPAGVPSTSLRATLARRLEDEQGLTAHAAHWAVDAWGAALNATPSSSMPARADHNEVHQEAEPATPPVTPVAADARLARLIQRAAIAAAAAGAVACVGMWTWNKPDPSMSAGIAFSVVVPLVILLASLALAWGIHARRRGAAATMVIWHAISMVAGWFVATPTLERAFDIAVFVLLVMGARAVYALPVRAPRAGT